MSIKMTTIVCALAAIADFGLASAELYRALSGNSSNPALALAVSMFCFGMGIAVSALIAGSKS